MKSGCETSMYIRPRAVQLCLLVFLSLSAGCSEQVNSEYGISGPVDRGSVAGLSVFSHMLEQNGCKVTQRRLLTPSFQKQAEVIVWAPNSFEGPSPQVVDWMLDWLAQDETRLLVFIGRDYHPLADYWRSCRASTSDPAALKELDTRINEALSDETRIRSATGGGAPDYVWYTTDASLGGGVAKELSGPWSEGINPAVARVYRSPILKPKDVNAQSLLFCEHGVLAFRANPFQELFTSEENSEESGDEEYPSTEEYSEKTEWQEAEEGMAESDDFNSRCPGRQDAYRQEESEDNDGYSADGDELASNEVAESGDGKSSWTPLLVVANGSFLLNLSLVNKEHRKLAQRLVDEIGPQRNVVMLESGFRGPRVAEKDPVPDLPLMLSLFQLPKIGLALVHLAVVAICFSFWKYPIFGRPSGWQDASDRDFGQHVAAYAELLRRARQIDFAEERLAEYHRVQDS